MLYLDTNKMKIARCTESLNICGNIERNATRWQHQIFAGNLLAQYKEHENNLRNMPIISTYTNHMKLIAITRRSREVFHTIK